MHNNGLTDFEAKGVSKPSGDSKLVFPKSSGKKSAWLGLSEI